MGQTTNFEWRAWERIEGWWRVMIFFLLSWMNLLSIWTRSCYSTAKRWRINRSEINFFNFCSAYTIIVGPVLLVSLISNELWIQYWILLVIQPNLIIDELYNVIYICRPAAVEKDYLSLSLAYYLYNICNTNFSWGKVLKFSYVTMLWLW